MMRRRLYTQRHRGAAFTEALVVVPILIIIFASMYLIYRGHIAKQKAFSAARTEVWTISNSGCPEDLTDYAEDGSTEQRIIKAAIDELPIIELLGDVFRNIFGESVKKTASEKYKAPSHFGGGEQTMTGTYKLVCNTERIDIWEAMKLYFCEYVPFC